MSLFNVCRKIFIGGLSFSTDEGANCNLDTDALIFSNLFFLWILIYFREA